MVNLSRYSHNYFVKWIWTVDKVILFISLALLVLGVILGVTASPAVAWRLNYDDYYFVKKQICYVVMAVVIIFTLSLFNLKYIRRLSILGFIVLIGLLVITMFWGSETKGARRWLDIFGFSLQVSEFIKPVFIVLVAWLLDCDKKYDYFQGTWIAIGLYLLLICLLLVQPDIGMSALISAVFALQLFLAGLPWLVVGVLSISAIISGVVFYFTFPHFRVRVDQFLYGKDEVSYQINRAMEAFQNGNLLGKGPGEGTAKLVVPDAHTDFIFAVAGEEYGLWLCLIIISLFAIIIVRVLNHAVKESNLFVMYAEVGLVASLGVQAFINMGSALHLIPTKGMTLPFISYGGSSLLSVSMTIGMLLAITRKNMASEDKDMY